MNTDPSISTPFCFATDSRSPKRRRESLASDGRAGEADHTVDHLVVHRGIRRASEYEYDTACEKGLKLDTWAIRA